MAVKPGVGLMPMCYFLVKVARIIRDSANAAGGWR
jgi:hypothetical protein